jgi:hypothetical protein
VKTGGGKKQGERWEEEEKPEILWYLRLWNPRQAKGSIFGYDLYVFVVLNFRSYGKVIRRTDFYFLRLFRLPSERTLPLLQARIPQPHHDDILR